jgi:1-acyl-sn-glycerol-3-phosphate acyltransferase
MVTDDSLVRPLDKKIGPFRVLRGRMFAIPFQLVHETTRWELSGQDRLIAVVEEHQRTGRGLITVSNHVSLFDDPLVFIALLNIRFPSEKNKCWYSTACANNFNPDGRSTGARVTRYFSEVSNMVFLSRAHKRGGSGGLDEDPIRTVLGRFDERLERHATSRASSLGLDMETYIQTFLTPWGHGMDPRKVQTFNQPGLIEASVRIDSGDWVHFFPEGGRSRDLHLRPARPGVGKVLYHSRDARVVPLCFYGTQDVMPVGAKLPSMGKTVHVSVGDPIEVSELAKLRKGPPNQDTFQALSNLAMEHISALRPGVLARYLGAETAAKLLIEEAQMKRALDTASGPQKVEEPGERPESRPAARDASTSRRAH